MLLDDMADTLVNLHPSNVRVWIKGEVGFGYKSLWAEAGTHHEKPPIIDQTGYLTVTADARLDNRQELIAKLGLDCLSKGETSDARLILAAYEKWGERCPEYLLGDFAFAIWDARLQRLLCAVDPIGIRSLFYFHSNECFAFGSQIRLLHALPDSPKEINEDSIATHLVLFNCHQPGETFYRGIYRLLPGHRLMVTREHLKIEPYWQLDLNRNIHLNSDEAYAEAFREIFLEAIRCRLQGISSVGIRLSGGIDSISVAAATRTVLGPNIPLHTLTAFFAGEGDIDERSFVDDLVVSGNFQAHFIDGNQINPLEDVVEVLAHHDEPIYNGFTWVDWRLNKLAWEQGIWTTLDGIDGDATVAPIDIGKSFLPELFRSGHWMAFWQEINALSRILGVKRRRALLVLGIKPLLPAGLLDAWRGFRGMHNLNPLATDIIHPDFSRKSRVLEKFNDAGGYFWSPQQTARQAHFLQATFSYEGRVEMMHRVAAPFGIECRHPFADVRLMEFCLALPSEQKFYRGLNRMVMRRALADLLPKSVFQRPDKGLLRAHYMRPLLLAATPHLLNELPALSSYVDMAALLRHRECYLETGDTNALFDIDRTMTLAFWLYPELAEIIVEATRSSSA